MVESASQPTTVDAKSGGGACGEGVEKDHDLPPAAVPLGVSPSPSVLVLCREALESLEKRKGEDVNEWAEKLARDVVPL